MVSFREPISSKLRVLVLSGQRAVTEQSPLLEALAERCGQSGAMNWLEYFVGAPTKLPKLPYLVLVVAADAPDEGLQLGDVFGAVLLFEYQCCGLGTGVFSTDDVSGFRTVIAPEEQRAMVAQAAMDALMEHRMQIALISYQPGSGAAPEPGLTASLQWAQRTRPVSNTLRLADTFEATLALFGRSTRAKLGYYRRKLMAGLPCEFVNDARGMLNENEMEALNRASLNPDKRAQLLAQYRACRLPGGFLLGLRTLDGRWLSLVGGWRQGDVTVLYWQMNASGYEKLSIVTAMRSYLLEHEIARGACSLVFYGGTRHSIQNAFVAAEVTDLFVRRTTLQAAVLQVVAKLFAAPRWFLGSPNFIARAICHEGLEWHPNGRNVGDAMSAETVRMQD